MEDSASPRYIVLLNDMILYCKNWTGSSLKCLRVLPVDKCAINAIGFQKGVFSLQCQSFSIVLCALEDPNVAHDWVEAIQNAIDQVFDIFGLRTCRWALSENRDIDFNFDRNVNFVCFIAA